MYISFAYRKFVALLAPLAVLLPVVSWGEDLRTVAEKSDFQATARYAEVMELAEKLAASSEKIQLSVLGETHEHRSIPLLMVADPPVATAKDAKGSGKLVVLLIGNIHAGEVCGKEALLMLAREIGTRGAHGLLDDLILALVPIYNADGNERVSKDNRRNQKGPKEGMGERANAQGLDLNRDYVKLEAPETRALMRFMNDWDPAVIIDTHTTNGSRHRYGLTYAGPRHPAGHPEVVNYVRNKMLPTVSREVEEKTGLKTYFYGNFREEKRHWSTYPDLPRYGTPYRGLRNRIAILSEAYAYSSYKERVLATRDFVLGCLEFLAANKQDVQKVIQSANAAVTRSGVNPKESDTIPLRTQLVAFEKKVRILGYGEDAKPQEYEVEFFGRFEPTLSVRRPYAYLVPSQLKKVTEKLWQHGIKVDELREDLELDLEVYRVERVVRREKPFQKHHLVSTEVSSRTEPRRVQAGTLVVRTAQPLGTLAAYLLEPQAPDGFCAWNFLDAELEEGKDYPVWRLLSKVSLFRSPYPSPEARPREKLPITFENVYQRGKRPPSGASVHGLRWLDDGEHWLQYRDGKLRKVQAESGRIKPFHDEEAMAQALAAITVFDEKTARSISRRGHFHWDSQKSAVLIPYERDLYYCPLFRQPADQGRQAVRLTSTPEVEEVPVFSPDGKFVAFVRENDLWVVDIATQTERALTAGGTETLRNGKASWVYYEEVLGRSWRTFWWSPNSRHIAYYQVDSSRTQEFTLVGNHSSQQKVERSTYPAPGQPNPTVRLGVVSVAGGATRWADFSDYDSSDLLLTGTGWWPDGSRLYFYAQNRIQSWLDFCALTPQGGKPKKLFRQTTAAWVDPPSEPNFLKDGSFLITSEQTGWKHIYHHDREGKQLRAVTEGEWEARKIHHLNEGEGWIYVSGTRDSHIAGNLYRVKLDGSRTERLTLERGSHRANVGPTGKLFLDTWSSHERPTRVVLRRADGSHARTIDSNPARRLDDYLWCPQELFTIRAADGFELHASLMKPPGFDATKRHPVWFSTYAGPHAPSISDSWGGGRIWDQVLSQSGIIVFRCDPRSASGKGAISAWSCYRQLGVKELEDIEEAIGWLTSQPYVDAKRIGMSGHSYGGFMTAYALTHSKLFRAGIAGAPVTDWNGYDSIYTERYMQTPQMNPEGYRVTSVVGAAKDLHGQLLIVHGTVDDNVHFQNSERLINALQRAGKKFEVMIYPGSRHGIHGRHYTNLRYDFIQRTVGGPPLGRLRAY